VAGHCVDETGLEINARTRNGKNEILIHILECDIAPSVSPSNVVNSALLATGPPTDSPTEETSTPLISLTTDPSPIFSLQPRPNNHGERKYAPNGMILVVIFTLI